MRVMITGSRLWIDRKLIKEELEKLPRNVIIVHGGARGADSIASDLAAEMDLDVEIHIPNWKDQGRSAGIIRNNKMLDSGIDLVLAFQVNDSRGTQHAIDGAKRRGIKTIVHRDYYR